jgi:hypothetical protein
MSRLILLDAEGEVTLEVGDFESGHSTKFQVSTKVLSLASPVFAKMFGPNFAEGTKIRNGELVNIKLEDDDGSAMEIILNLLHYRGTEQLSVTSETIANIAMLCDKYDCVRAMTPWTCCWFMSLQEDPQSPIELGCLLLAAYKMTNLKEFMKISARSMNDLPPNFISKWRENDLLSLLPDEFICRWHKKQCQLSLH